MILRCPKEQPGVRGKLQSGTVQLSQPSAQDTTKPLNCVYNSSYSLRRGHRIQPVVKGKIIAKKTLTCTERWLPIRMRKKIPRQSLLSRHGHHLQAFGGNRRIPSK